MGGGVSFDTIIIDNLFLNSFNENLFFNASAEFYFFPVDNQSKTNHQWDLALEAGPRYAAAVGKAGIAFALSVNWRASRENDLTAGGASSHLLTFRPTLALELTSPFRINIAIEYACPLYGKNNYAAHTITIKAPVNFNFAKNK
jgi:hypothetical protein